jgi:hypothetical protein
LDITSEQLSTSLAKLASTFERDSLEASKKEKQQHPNWDHLSIPSQQTILRAIRNNCHSATAKPTDTYSEFLRQRSAAAAKQYLIEYFEANHCSRNVCINQGMTSVLWLGVLRAHKIGSSQTLSPFFVPCWSASCDTSSTPNLIGQHLKQIEGQGLDSTDDQISY